MPFLVSVSETANLAALKHFVIKNHGIALEYPGWFLVPWQGVPDLLTQTVRRLAPKGAKVIVAAVADYWWLN